MMRDHRDHAGSYGTMRYESLTLEIKMLKCYLLESGLCQLANRGFLCDDRTPQSKLTRVEVASDKDRTCKVVASLN